MRDPITGAPRNGRCRLHGGTPKSPEGIAAIVAANQRRARLIRPVPRPPAPECDQLRLDGEPCHAPAVLDPRTERPHNGACRWHGGTEGLEVPTMAAIRKRQHDAYHARMRREAAEERGHDDAEI